MIRAPLCLLAVASCSRADDRASAPSKAAPVASGGGASPSVSPVSVATVSDPVDAARQFVERGLSGQQLPGSPCLRQDVVSCSHVGVVGSYRLDSATVRGDSARVLLHVAELGTLIQGRRGALRFVPSAALDSSARTDTLTLVNRSGVWQVVSDSSSTPRVSPQLAMYHFELEEGMRDSIGYHAHLSVSSETRPVFTAPAMLTQLPQTIRDTLTVRGCTVMQRRGELTDNVLRGAFFGVEEGDWAVLCVRKGDATILVFPRAGGAVAELETVTGAVPDPSALPYLGESNPYRYGCETGIMRTPASALRQDVAAGDLTGELPGGSLSTEERRAPVHDGILSGDCEGLSNIYYWTGRRWVLFAGGD